MLSGHSLIDCKQPGYAHLHKLTTPAHGTLENACRATSHSPVPKIFADFRGGSKGPSKYLRLRNKGASWIYRCNRCPRRGTFYYSPCVNPPGSNITLNGPSYSSTNGTRHNPPPLTLSILKLAFFKSYSLRQHHLHDPFLRGLFRRHRSVQRMLRGQGGRNAKREEPEDQQNRHRPPHLQYTSRA